MNKIVILILSTQNVNYDPFIVALRETWVKKAKAKSIECFFYEGGYEKSYIDGDTIKLNVNDNLNSTSEKLIEAITMLQDNNIEFDFIFRTNLSSFIFVDQFLSFFYINSRNIVYSGVRGKYVLFPAFINRFGVLGAFWCKFIKKNIVEFASGSGFWLSKSAVEILLSAKNRDYKLIDDVMVGKVMNENKIPVSICDRLILEDDKFISNNIDISRMKANYHIRLKSFKSRDIDIKRMYMLDKIEISDNVESDLISILNC